MDTVGVNVIETAALGRPFQLGTLYDCRKDALIQGITLWNSEDLKKKKSACPQTNTEFNVTASDSIEDKSNLMNIDGSLKLSVLGGLVSVSGSAKYLKDTKKSFKQQRLTLHYHSTCEFQHLTMDLLAPENITYPSVLDKDTATHVVTAVLYGADAYFVFDREDSSDEHKNTVEGEAKVAFKKLEGISAGAKINLNMNDTQKNAVQKFTCTFYGDFQLPSNPTSFEDALKVFTDLPNLLGEKKELAVPLRVWLYPLDKLHSGASKLQKDISMDLIIETESVIESLNTTEMKCNDLLKDSPASTFAEFRDKILQMKQNCHGYKLRLMNKLGSLLPNIRGDVMKETDLNNLLQEHDESPFRGRDLTEWLKERERESDIIKSVLRQLKDAGAQASKDCSRVEKVVLIDMDVENLVCYTFTSLNWSDFLLYKQSTYLSMSAKEEMNENSPDSVQKSWLTREIWTALRTNLKIFKNLMDSKDRKPAKFIVSSKDMKNNPGSCILLYESECDEAVCFIPPSKPACPITEEAKEKSVVLKVPPSCPATVELRLLYKRKQETVWRSKPVMKDELTVTLTDLRAGTEYEIKCAALGKLNYTVYGDVISVTTKGRNMSVLAYCGLINQGATSYLNAVLQTLYMTPEYREGVMRLERREDSSDGDFIEELKSLFNKLDNQSHLVSTVGISRSLGITDVYEHKDAAEYLDLILSKTPELSEIFKLKVSRNGRCGACKKEISEQSDYLRVNIAVKGPDVENALKRRIGEMTLDEHDCEQIIWLSNTTSHFDVPQRLILQLENAQLDRRIIPSRIEVSSHRYELYAIINLYGTVKDGHYNANIKSENGEWYRCDDSHVFQLFSKLPEAKIENDRFIMPVKPSSDSLRSPHAYLIFYKRSPASVTPPPLSEDRPTIPLQDY